jgi:hypothetical protein
LTTSLNEIKFSCIIITMLSNILAQAKALATQRNLLILAAVVSVLVGVMLISRTQGFSMQGEYPGSISAANERIPGSLPFPGVTGADNTTSTPVVL